MQAAASILYGGDSQDCLSLQALVSGQEGQNPGSPIESLPFPVLSWESLDGMVTPSDLIYLAVRAGPDRPSDRPIGHVPICRIIQL